MKGRILVRRHLRKRRPVKAYIRTIKRRPQQIGTFWIDKQHRNIHGPRLIPPKNFKRLYLFSQDRVKRQKRRIKNYNKFQKSRLPKSTKVKIGELKKDGLAIQSFITPVKDWKKVSVPPYKKAYGNGLLGTKEFIMVKDGKEVKVKDYEVDRINQLNLEGYRFKKNKG